MSMTGGRNGQMDLVQQMLMEKQKNQVRPPPDDGIMGGLAGMVGQANPAAGIGLSMLDKGGKALSDTMTAPVEGLGKVLSGMRDLPKPGAAGGNDIRSMLQSQMVGMKQPGSIADALPPAQSGADIGAAFDKGGPQAPLGLSSPDTMPQMPKPQAPNAPPPPAKPSVTGDVMQQGQQNNYQPNVRAPMGINPFEEAKRKAAMQALGGGIG